MNGTDSRLMRTMGTVAGPRDLAVEESVAAGAMDLDALLLVGIQQREDLVASEAFDCLFHREGDRRDRIRDEWFHFVLLVLFLFSFDLPSHAHLVICYILLDISTIHQIYLRYLLGFFLLETFRERGRRDATRDLLVLRPRLRDLRYLLLARLVFR
jgi:hypothetical protein